MRDNGKAVASLTNPESPDHFKIALAVVKPQILQEARTPGNHHQQPSAAGVVFRMRLEMLGEIGDPSRQERDLYFGGTCVRRSSPERPNDLLLFLLRDRHRTPQNRRLCNKALCVISYA